MLSFSPAGKGMRKSTLILKIFYLMGIGIFSTDVLGTTGREYFGKFIGNFNQYAHKVAGRVYAVDEDTIFIKDFSYDGLGPDVFFWVGNDKQPSPNGMIVPYPDVYSEKEPRILEMADGDNILLQLPPGIKLKDIKWLSVWCRRFTVNFGEVYIPTNLDPPRRRVLPEFTREAHGLKSGNVTILDAKTFYIPNLHYDGAGPDAFFWVGTGSSPHAGGRKIPNEKGSTEVLSGYQGEDIELTLPGDLTVFDIDWLSMWCISYKHNFGHVLIPKNLNIPPTLGEHRKTPTFKAFPATMRPSPPRHHEKKRKKVTSEYKNCKELAFSNKERKRAQIQWEKDGSTVKFKVTAKITEDQYFSLGFSPIKGIAKMVGGDAIVMYYTPTERKKFHADDYYMTAKSQCDGREGVCPDSRIGGRNDIKVINGDRRNGYTMVAFERPINTHESKYDISLDEEVNIMIAVGSLNGRKEANFHHGERTSSNEDIRISVHSQDDHNCTHGDDFSNMRGTSTEEDGRYKAWPPAFIENVTNFTVRIGPTGGKRGYTAITGSPSWGIAWWVNELLIPDIYVERGKTYYFQVQGGDDSKNPSKYHPLYITDHPEGGYSQRREFEQRQQRVFAGVGWDSSGYPYPTAVGQYCEYEHKTVDKSAQSETFEDFKKTLRLVCSDDGKPGSLIWTVADDTPDIVYYQCYTHNNLGWRIHVVNAGFRLRRDSETSGIQRISYTISWSLSTVLVLLVSIRYCHH